jgi:AAA domain/UvrD-like helicase C-terminal domain
MNTYNAQDTCAQAQIPSPLIVEIIRRAYVNEDGSFQIGLIAPVTCEYDGRLYKINCIKGFDLPALSKGLRLAIHDDYEVEEWRGNIQINVRSAAAVLPEFEHAPDVVLARRGVLKKRIAELNTHLGPDYPSKILADPSIIQRLFPRIKEPGANAIIEGCKAFLGCSVLQSALNTVRAKQSLIDTVRDFDLSKHSVYDLVPRGFPIADAEKLAIRLDQLGIRSFNPHDPARITELTRAEIKVWTNLWGDAGLSLARIQEQLHLTHAMPPEIIEQGLVLGAEARDLHITDGLNRFVYLKSVYDAEENIADIVHEYLAKPRFPSRRLGSFKVVVNPGRLNERKIQLDADQIDGLKRALPCPIWAISGGPGTGKTTLLTFIVQLFDDCRIVAVAGRAAQHAAETTGGEAYTVAKVVGFEGYSGDADLLLGLDVLIIEECSMLSSVAFGQLLDFADYAGVKRIILCGDANQLQPIEEGSPFLDIINSGLVPVVWLHKNHRTDPASLGIASLCEEVLRGEFDCSPRPGVAFIPIEGDDADPTVAASVETYLAKAKEFGLENTVIIAAFKDEERGGTHSLNNAVRRAFGLRSGTVQVNEIFLAQPGCKEAVNGTRLIVTSVQDRTFTARSIGTDRDIVIPLRPHKNGPAKNIDWGYAATIHKFQGSEAQAVIFAIPPNTTRIIQKQPWLLDRSCVYTAFSRASKSLTVVGEFEQLREVLQYERRKRITALPYFLDPSLEPPDPADPGAEELDPYEAHLAAMATQDEANEAVFDAWIAERGGSIEDDEQREVEGPEELDPYDAHLAEMAAQDEINEAAFDAWIAEHGGAVEFNELVEC